MKEIFQKSWFEIPFSSLEIPCSSKRLAGQDFYSAFYDKFFESYTNYSELPISWLNFKNEIVEHLLSLIEKNDSILSIGSGIGYIENELILKSSELEIIAIEPNVANMMDWMNSKVKFLNGYFTQVLETSNSSKFNFVFSSSIDYVFNDEEYIRFLKSVVDFGIKDYFITEIFLDNCSKVWKIKHFIKSSLDALGLRDLGQFWGYLRTYDEHINLLKRSGFNHFHSGRYNHGACWIRAMV
jgi:hypothetical protein